MPKTNEAPRKDERITARITPNQKTLFRRAAEIEGRSLTDFILRAAHDEAMRTIERQRLITLSEQDQKAFASALLDPKPNKRLNAAARKHMGRIADDNLGA
ncbi:MAG: DUF1778 domain-containing protein [Alphaproteobacteria bacterium]|jgi:uncharacterized protein (DUF1778 family)|nr:DUF1778 domain-containing protein [Alphaproteobacteria bacterium]